MRRPIAALALLLCLAACDRRPAAPALVLDQPPGGPAMVEAKGLDSATLDALRRLPAGSDAWAPLFSISVGPNMPPVMGRYAVANGDVRFTPAFPLEPGKTYLARLDLGRIDGRAAPPLVVRLTAAEDKARAAARLAAVYPSGAVWPQNLLRLYLQFSAPMAVGRPGTLSLVDDRGRALDEPFLPLGYEFWSPDHTRLTVLIDPGRVKRGILPGSVLEAGRRYTLVVGADWLDARSGRIAAGYRQQITAGPPARTALDLKAWRITAPQAGSRAPLRVGFGRAIDHGLLLSALGVNDAEGARVEGKAGVEPGETAWSFTPDHPWRVEGYRLMIQPWLEDAAGNRPGRAFERAADVPGRAVQTGLLDLKFQPGEAPQ